MENTPNIENEIRLRYSAIRSIVPNGMPTTILHIGAEQTSVAIGTGAEPDTVHVFSIGSRKTAAEYFHHDPPTPRELENAIVAVEDALAGARKMIPVRSRLVTADDAIRKIALISGVPDAAELTLTRDAMERTFERLTAITLGRTASGEGIPAGLTFAATLLILREFMHHLQFLSIAVKDSPALTRAPNV